VIPDWSLRAEESVTLEWPLLRFHLRIHLHLCEEQRGFCDLRFSGIRARLVRRKGFLAAQSDEKTRRPSDLGQRQQLKVYYSNVGTSFQLNEVPSRLEYPSRILP
jgi:hypothetical protein